jgi:hypothetical protein
MRAHGFGEGASLARSVHTQQDWMSGGGEHEGQDMMSFGYGLLVVNCGLGDAIQICLLPAVEYVCRFEKET